MPSHTRQQDRTASAVVPSPRLTSLLEALEPRTLLSATGGGWTAGGLVGEYYNNPDLSGEPSFIRRDVRIDFDWGTTSRPGGSVSSGFADLGVDGYGVRWTGKLIARHSETYTFKAFADDAFKLELRPVAGEAWTTVIDQAAAVGAGTAGQMALEAGSKYEVRITFREETGAAEARLVWSSPSTPRETIDPVRELGFNVDSSWNQAFVDLVKGARGNFEGVDNGPRPAQDAFGWPMGNGAYIWQESLRQGLDLDPLTQGRISFSFQGRANLSFNGNVQSGSLVSSYDSATNTTTGSFVAADRDWNATSFIFRATDRDGDFGADGLPDNDGITGLRLMKPTAPGAATSYGPGVIFQPQLKNALQHYTNLRVDLNNANQERNWSDRTLPSYFNQQRGKLTGRIYSTGSGVGNGASWEHKVMLANETGRDLYVNLPMAATGWSASDTESYVYKLALLLKYGSDGVEPYTSPQANPAFPPLNPNLRVYVELSNEYWNYAGDAFRQAWDLDAMVTADADAHLNGGVHPTGDPLARPSDFPILNYDNLPTTKNSSGAYGQLGLWRKRKMALRTVQISEVFRDVFGDAAMPGTSTNPRVRPVYEFQYENANNTASDALRFLETYFNNGDGVERVATPRPVSYYLYGAGGASYYGSANQWGVTNQLSDPSFESPVVPAGYNPSPVGSDWTFSGEGGIARDGGAADDIPPGAKLGTASTSAQMAYLTGTSSMERSFAIPETQTSSVYSISFKSVQRGADRQRLFVYVDGVLVNARSAAQSVGYTPDGYSASKPWNSRVVAWADSEYYQTLTFTAAPGSSHTVRFVGQVAGATAFVDDVRLSSVDAIFEGGMPSGGSFANGQTPAGAYKARLDTQARWAQAYGLNYVTYEGGWALGGDTGGSPLQNHAKYNDPRAGAVNRLALDLFTQAGGTNNTLGTYAQWPSWDNNVLPPREGLLDLGGNTLWQGQVAFLDSLPAAVNNGTTLGTATRTLTNAAASLRFNAASTGATVNRDGWLSWNVVAEQAGTWNMTVDAAAGSTLQLLVDGKVVEAFDSTHALTRAPFTLALDAGVHSIRLKAIGGAASIDGIVINPGPGGEVGPALAIYDFAGNPYDASTGGADSVGAHVVVSDVTNGPGFKVNTATTISGGLLVQPIGTTTTKYAATLDSSISRGEYQAFTIVPGGGRKLSLSALRLTTYFQGGPSTRGVGLRYSLDGGATFATHPSTFVGAAADTPTFDLSSIAAMQGAAGQILFRVHYFGGNATSTIGLGNRAGNDVTVLGTVLAPPVNAAPTVTTPAAATPGVVADKTTTLGVDATDDTGEGGLVYTWSLLDKPAGAADPTFTGNGDNAAKSVVATFAKAGTYRFLVTVTDPNGATATSQVQVTVAQTLTAISVNPASATVATNGSVAFSVTAADQFGDAMSVGDVAWSLLSGDGSIDAATGVYTAGGAAGEATLRASVGDVTSDATILIELAAPAAPANLAAAAASSTQVDLTWTDLSNNESKFVIERSTDPTFASGVVAVDVPAGATSFSATGLAGGVTYHFRVLAANDAGASAPSAVASATTPVPLTPPVAPASVVAEALSRSQIRVRWTDASANEKGFYVEMSGDGGRTFTRVASPAAGATSFTMNNLLSNTVYTFRVAAWNDAGASAFSNLASARTRKR